MAKFKVSDLYVYIEDPSASQTADVVTNVTNASPAVVTPTTIASFNDGDTVLMAGTGFTTIDDKYWRVANKGASTFELECADTSAEAAPSTTGTATPYDHTTDLLRFCPLTNASLVKPAPDTIDVLTMCGREFLSGEPQEGNLTWDGPIDPCDSAWQAMESASNSNTQVLVEFYSPTATWWVHARVELNQLTQDLNAGSVGNWSGGGIIKLDPTWRTCSGCP